MVVLDVAWRHKGLGYDAVKGACGLVDDGGCIKATGLLFLDSIELDEDTTARTSSSAREDGDSEAGFDFLDTIVVTSDSSCILRLLDKSYDSCSCASLHDSLPPKSSVIATAAIMAMRSARGDPFLMSSTTVSVLSAETTRAGDSRSTTAGDAFATGEEFDCAVVFATGTDLAGLLSSGEKFLQWLQRQLRPQYTEF